MNSIRDEVVAFTSRANASLFNRITAFFGMALGVSLLRAGNAQAQDHVDYRFEDYAEEGGRIHVQTDSALFDVQLRPWLGLKGDFVYDAISGATPTGAPPPSQINFFAPPAGLLSNKVPLVPMHDTRYSGSIETDLDFGRNHIRPEFSYSEEHDYISYGASLNYSIDFNQKNTTLNVGWSHDWDRILAIPGEYVYQAMGKDSDEVFIGVNQLLTPKTVLTANFTFHDSEGYMNDPYRGVLFDDYPQGDPNNIALFAESRPRWRDSYIGYVSLTQFITPANASVEVSERIYDDSYGIFANTFEFQWHQKIGRRIMISPIFRYYRQTAASFYGTHFAGDPSNPFDPTPIPAYYSSDYRLSAMETFTYGVAITAKITDWASLDLSYKRYEMYGMDGVTSPSAYPKANIVTVGARIWF